MLLAVCSSALWGLSLFGIASAGLGGIFLLQYVFIFEVSTILFWFLFFIKRYFKSIRTHEFWKIIPSICGIILTAIIFSWGRNFFIILPFKLSGKIENFGLIRSGLFQFDIPIIVILQVLSFISTVFFVRSMLQKNVANKFIFSIPLFFIGFSFLMLPSVVILFEDRIWHSEYATYVDIYKRSPENITGISLDTCAKLTTDSKRGCYYQLAQKTADPRVCITMAQDDDELAQSSISCMQSLADEEKNLHKCIYPSDVNLSQYYMRRAFEHLAAAKTDSRYELLENVKDKYSLSDNEITSLTCLLTDDPFSKIFRSCEDTLQYPNTDAEVNRYDSELQICRDQAIQKLCSVFSENRLVEACQEIDALHKQIWPE
ncbi:MAG: hypothetical protein G01um101433_1122 [Parcubacteria group bacterium Gr01-1014_33]|nr:MAG: hypothetical protein G01um101433_1122 [Parcubacteria group bacterium Gr01-1014_33]